ncbi:Hcp family type VI secretion system effector [Halioxenophilus aromaticivorans]|uniref:Type VI secretion system tube protein Hcp n=1 Tax=Halioxenophilus aromaticivorans TaxID=1306992 RepID=A0AAV3U8M0_9ALTE
MSSIFMFHSGVEGETADSGHPGWMDINYLKWGTKRQITSHSSTKGDRESSNTIITDLILFKRMDKATPKLFLLACCGTGAEIKIHFTKTGAGDSSHIFMEYVLKNAMIKDYSVTSKSQSTIRPLEKITISFTAMEKKYTPYDENGVQAAPMTVGFDTANNTKT